MILLSEEKYISALSEIERLTYNTSTMKVELPRAKSGDIKIVGSNAISVIDLTGNVFEPLEAKKVKVTLKMNNDDSKEFIISVAGKYKDNGINEKPHVIPALAEWHGLEGTAHVNNDVIVVAEDDKFNDVAKMFVDDLKEIDINLALKDKSNSESAIIFKLDKDNGLAKEGYAIAIKDNQIIIYAEEHTGAYYATRSLHQILKANQNHQLPNGYIRDYPKYPIRGFMLDVGRKFTKLDYIYDMMKTMSYYKINDFQIHLNDNAIFLEHFEDAKESLEKAYTGFRLESDLKGNGHQLTSTDGFYTKDEFRELIVNSAKYGVTIVPEFDTPGHAMSFVKIRPELMYDGSIVNGKIDHERAAMLNLDHEETLPFIKSMYDEFLDGEKPVLGNVPIHIGSDEYYGEAEVYRKYVDDLLKYISQDKNRTARVWGSLTNKAGETPIISKGIQMSAWNTNWSEPNEMIELGFDIINIEDHQVYIVPGADYYHDYLEVEKLYNEFKTNKFNNGAVIDESHPQLIGGGFALWNDQIDKLENGITSYDMFDRIFDALPILAQKFWDSDTNLTYEEFRALSEKTAYAPHTNLRFSVPAKTDAIVEYDFTKGTTDLSGNRYDIVKESNVQTDGGMKFNGQDSYLETPLSQIGPDAELTIEFKLNQTDQKQVLLEVDGGAVIYAINDDGFIGYKYETNAYSFNYKLKANEKVTLKFVTRLHKTTLFVDGKEIELTEDSKMKFNTLILPLQRISSLENSLDGIVSNLKVERE